METKDNVTHLRPVPEADFRLVLETIEEAQAQHESWSQVVVLALGPEGEIISLTSHEDPALNVLMCERAKAQILQDLG